MKQGEVEKFQLRLDALKYGVNNNDDDNENKGSGGGGGGRGDDGTPGPGPPPPRTPQQEMEDIVRRLDILWGNTSDVSPANTPAQNSRIIAWQNEERGKLEKEKEKFQTYLKEKLIRWNRTQILIFQIRPPKHLLEGQIEENSMTKSWEKNWTCLFCGEFILDNKNLQWFLEKFVN